MTSCVRRQPEGGIELPKQWRCDCTVIAHRHRQRESHTPGVELTLPRRWVSMRTYSPWIQEIDRHGRAYEWHAVTRRVRWSRGWATVIEELRERLNARKSVSAS